MTRILVTGANGLIGRHAVTTLVNHGLDVHAVSRTMPDTSAPGVTWHACDLLDCQEIFYHVQATHFLHLAWVTEHGHFWDAAENRDWQMASIQLIKTFHQQGGERLVMAGSCAEYDFKNDNLFRLCHYRGRKTQCHKTNE